VHVRWGSEHIRAERSFTKSFQGKNGLVQDGSVGPATRPEPTVDAYMQPKEMTRQYDEWFEKYGKEVLFEDFEIATNKEGEKVILGDYTCLKVSDLENGTIEDLVKYVHIKLSKSAVKRIFG
jgi:hypothetical protein